MVQSLCQGWRACPSAEGRHLSRIARRIQELDGKNYWTVGKARELISKGTGVTYSISSVYRLLKHWQYRLRTPVKRHVRIKREDCPVQKELAEFIPEDRGGPRSGRAGRDNRAADARPRRVYTKKGKRAVCTVTGSHGKTIVYGLQTDGRSMCAQYGRFTADDFVDFLKRVRRRFPKIVIILDRAPQHTAKVVKQLEGETEGLELARMPRPQRNGREVEADEATFLTCRIPLLICSRSVRRKLDGSPPRTNYMKREELLQLYREEKDPSVKDRLMLIIKAKFDDASITKAAGSLGRVTSWGSKW